MIPNRIELAARAAFEWCGNDVAWSEAGKTVQDHWRDEATRILAAAFPELFTDPPQVWLAPVEATEAMQNAAWRAMNIGGLDPMPAMRDAHLASQSDKPETTE